MSKLAILKELYDLKAFAQRRSLWKWGAVIAAVSYLAVSYGGDAWTYLSTAGRMAASNLRANVPLEFELERARTMIDGLIPDVRKNMLVIAQEEVAVEDLRKDLERTRSDLSKQREELLRMRADLDGNSKEFVLGTRRVTREELKTELTRRFNRFQVVEATIASTEQLLMARETSLQAARTRLDNMLSAKRDLEVQVENLQARLKTQQSHTLASSIEVDDSEVTRCQQLLSEVRLRLEVADRLIASNGDYGMMTATSIPSSADDIGVQIDQHFGKSARDQTLAKAK